MESEQLMRHMMEVEELAEEVVADRQQLVDMDRRRQQTREAVRALQKTDQTEKAWVCFGDMFIKMPVKAAKSLLNKDQDKLDDEISDIRSKLKPKVNRLRDMEHKEELKGFSLQPLSSNELSSLHDVL